MTYFDPFFKEVWLFLTDSKWGEYPHSKRLHIFATLKLQKQFWKKLLFVASLKHNSTLKFTIYIEQRKDQVRNGHYLVSKKSHLNQNRANQGTIL